MKKHMRKPVTIHIGDIINYGMYSNLEVVGETESGLSYILKDNSGDTNSFYKELVEKNSTIVKPCVTFREKDGKTIYQRLRVKRYHGNEIEELNTDEYAYFLMLFNLKFDRLIELGRYTEVERQTVLQSWSDTLCIADEHSHMLFIHMTDDRELSILGLVKLGFNKLGIQNSYRLEEVYASKEADYELAVETLKVYLKSIFGGMESTMFKHFTYEKETHVSDTVFPIKEEKKRC